MEFNIKGDSIFLLANKSDKIDENSYEEKGRELANKLNINFFKVSAENGEGVGNLIENLAYKIDKCFYNKD